MKTTEMSLGTKIVKNNYAGRKALIRIAKFCFFYNDVCGYGLFRRKAIEKVKYPIWWGVNKKTAINNIYPTILYFLSVGDFHLVNTKVLYYKRVKKQVNHVVPFSNNFILKVIAYFLRKINVMYASLANIYKGSNPSYSALIAFPFILFRFFLDWFAPVVRRIRVLKYGTAP